jgi:hypothetical protein
MRKFLLLALLCASAPAMAKTESWYWGMDFGFGSVSMPSALDDQFNAQTDAGGGSRFGVGSSLHFYWPFESAPNQVLGVASSGVLQYISVKATNRRHEVSTGVVGPSFVHTFSDEPFKGWFLRGDAGLATARIDYEGAFDGDDHSGVGFGMRAGGGYGFAASEETRIPVQASLTRTWVEGDSFGSFSIEVGFLL